MDNYLAPVRTRSLPDLLATQPASGICPGNRGWGRQGLPAHVPWHRTAIRRICTVHRRVLCTAPYTRDLAGAGVIGACSHAGPGRREVSAAAVGTAASASRPRSKGRNVPGSAQCGSPRRCAPSCCCSCWSSSWKTASAWTSAPSALTGTCRRESRSCWLASWEMLLAVIEAPGRRIQQRNAAPKSPDLTPSAAPHSHDGAGGRIRPARQPADHQAGRPSRPGTRDNDPCRRQRRLQRPAIHDAEGSACGVLRQDFPSP